jgi:hypothetical protein
VSANIGHMNSAEKLSASFLLKFFILLSFPNHNSTLISGMM